MGLKGLRNSGNKKSPRSNRKNQSRSRSSRLQPTSKKSSRRSNNLPVMLIGLALLLVIGVAAIAMLAVGGEGPTAIPPSTTSIPLIVNTNQSTQAPFTPTPTQSIIVRSPIPPDDSDDMALLTAARDNPAKFHLRYGLNITLNATIGGINNTIELIGDGLFSIDDTMSSMLFDGAFDGTFKTSASSDEVPFTLDARIVDEALFFRFVPGTSMPATEPWQRVTIDNMMGDMMDQLVDVDTLPELPDIEELMRDFDLSTFAQLTQLPDEQAGTIAHFHSDINVIEALRSQQAQNMVVHIYNFMPEALESMEERGTIQTDEASRDADLSDLTEEEVRAGYILMVGLVRRIIPTFHVQIHEFVNKSERLMSGHSVDIDIETDAAQMEQFFGIAGLSAVNLDIIVNYSDHGGRYSLESPTNWVDVELGVVPIPTSS